MLLPLPFLPGLLIMWCTGQGGRRVANNEFLIRNNGTLTPHPCCYDALLLWRSKHLQIKVIKLVKLPRGNKQEQPRVGEVKQKPNSFPADIQMPSLTHPHFSTIPLLFKDTWVKQCQLRQTFFSCIFLCKIMCQECKWSLYQLSVFTLIFFCSKLHPHRTQGTSQSHVRHDFRLIWPLFYLG